MKKRLDVLMHQRGLADSRSQAQRLIMAGEVEICGQRALHASDTIDEHEEITIRAKTRYVSRGGEKLEAALVGFNLTDLKGLACADVGASTGGFTDCLLQHGAARVYSIDVGYGELHWKLRNDSRVCVMEKTNARYVKSLPEKIGLAAVDASFISLKNLLCVIRGWLASPDSSIIALIKPQFEAGKIEAGKHKGVIRDPLVHREVLRSVLGYALANGFGIHGLIRSPLLGPKGNIEFLTMLNQKTSQNARLDEMIDVVLPTDVELR